RRRGERDPAHPDRAQAPQGLTGAMTMACRALAQVRVLDLGSGLAAPLAARLLGDFGADVIKVEPKGGDPSRQLRPLLDDGPVAERSLLFAYLNWNKRGITVEYGTKEARATVEALV